MSLIDQITVEAAESSDDYANKINGTHFRFLLLKKDLEFCRPTWNKQHRDPDSYALFAQSIQNKCKI
jgi:hypothetical protein